MSTERQVDRLLWAVAEAHRLRAEQEQRSAARLAHLDLEVRSLDEAFVTEWQPADQVRCLSASAR